ncbi:CvpA family protein [Limnohabitans sp. Jir72]|uniref:CvpA family protein n=1 Tax=Limnohabitans sp. Jir72 TaxID=1977909 RepID=UPI000D39DED6|nr:CvpA family protein [Limnohabitans sp. Jir72]PUE31882.1 colicin V synthesis protein [Limnohabitans sp. Jir72]
MTLSIIDWLLLGVLCASMLVGLWRGLVYEVLSLSGWVFAFFLAQWLATDVIVWIPFVQGAAASVQYAAAYVVVFVAVLFASALLSWLVKKLVESVGLRPVDRALGGAFGLARGLVLLLAMTVVFQLTGLSRSDWWKNAKGPVFLDMTVLGLKPLMPESIVRFLP